MDNGQSDARVTQDGQKRVCDKGEPRVMACHRRGEKGHSAPLADRNYPMRGLTDMLTE